MRLVKPLLAVSLLLFVGVALYRWQMRASRWREQLDESPTLTLYSLEPNPMAHAEHLQHVGRYAILGQMKVSGHEKDVVVSAVRDSEWIHNNMGGSSCGFSPRVAIQSEDEQTLVLLCFSCGDGVVAISGARKNLIIYPRFKAEGERSEDQLLSVLRRHHIPLSKPINE